MPLKRKFVPKGLDYLNYKPKRINWQIVAEAPSKTLSQYESYDLLFDEYDYKIRGLGC